MFPWSRPSLPLAAPAKAWVEERLQWLMDEFGADDLLREPMIVPTAEFFPDPYDGTERDARVLFSRVCRYMGADPSEIDLRFYSEASRPWLVNDAGHYLPGSAGLYGDDGMGTVIRIENANLLEPHDLVGTMAHELAHLRLLGEDRVPDDVWDNELLTDLTVVYFRLGTFLANSPRAWVSAMGLWPGTTLKRPEYMSLPMYGYALALIAWLRGEAKPAWARFLRPDARAAFKPALRYLRKTADAPFDPPAVE